MLASLLAFGLLAVCLVALVDGSAKRSLPPLRTLLVTGDSSATVLDQDLAQRLSGNGVEVSRDPQDGGSISKPLDLAPVNWVTYSRRQAKDHPGGAIVMFLGVNEGHPFRGKSVKCCGPDWVSIFATRVASIMDHYLAAGSRVYWLTVPAPRSRERQKSARAINKAVRTAADPRRSRVTVVDIVPIITPDFVYRTTRRIDGHATIIREIDSQHLNDAGSNLAADEVLKALRKDFDLGGLGRAEDNAH